MANLSRINKNPRLAKYLIFNRKLVQTPLIIADIGARGGIEGHWRLFENQAKILGFEPDIAECERLNQKNSNFNIRYYPSAFFDNEGEKEFYTTRYEPSSGLYKPDLDLYSRFHDAESFEIVRTSKIRVTTLDKFIKDNRMDRLDFIKIDAEGAEFEILSGSQETLRGVLGLSIEIQFTPTHIGQKTFSDIDLVLKKAGFKLLDLELKRELRKTLPRVPEDDYKKQGQLVWGQALYIRDLVQQKQSPETILPIDIEKTLKTACLLDLFCFQDMAIELIKFANTNKIISDIDCAELISHTTPTINNKIVSYDQYWQQIENKKSKISKREKSVIKIRRILTLPLRAAARILRIAGLKKHGQIHYEERSIKLVRELLKKGDVFIDAGAHTGLYTIAASRAVGSNGQVHAFEPASDTFKILERNIKKIRAKNIFLNKRALDKETGKATLFLNENSGLTSLGQTKRGKVIGTEIVSCTKLDDYVESNKLHQVDFLKIDVEGFEGQVLEGAKSLLNNQTNLIILCELSYKNYYPMGLSALAIMTMIKEKGFEVWGINNNGFVKFYTDSNPLSDCQNFIFIKNTHPSYKLFEKLISK